MPKTSKRGKAARSRPRGGNRSGLTIATVVPNAFRTTMVYHTLLSLTEAAVNTGAYNAYSLIDLNDPDKTGVGAQPVGYDQWGQMYSRFKVTSVTLELQAVNRNNNAALVGWFVHNTLAPTSSVQAWPAQRYAGCRLLQANTGGGSTADFRATFKLWDLMSLTKQQYMDELDFSQVSGAGPVKQVYFSAFCQGFGTAAVVSYDLKIKYSVELSDPVSLGMS